MNPSCVGVGVQCRENRPSLFVCGQNQAVQTGSHEPRGPAVRRNFTKNLAKTAPHGALLDALCQKSDTTGQLS
jgi:hypothetical protein